MEDPNTTKNLRSKEKSQLMIEGVMENQQNPSKKQDIPINISIVSSADNISHNAFAISLKKNKKISSYTFLEMGYLFGFGIEVKTHNMKIFLMLKQSKT
jgi:hypothetical protein